MDKAIVKKPQISMKFFWLICGGALIYLVYQYVISSAEKVVYVEENRLNISRVEQGEFEDFVTIRGNFQSAVTVNLDSIVAGQVEQVFVEDGAFVEKGQVLISLTNAAMQIELLQNEVRITEQLNNMRQQELSLEQNRIAHLKEIIELDHQVKHNRRKLAKITPLYKTKAVAEQEFEEAQDLLDYYLALKKVAVDSQRSDIQMQESQLAQLATATRQLEQGLAFARDNVTNLNVKAPVSGRLTAFDVKQGTSFSQGERLGRIDDPENYKVTSFVDEFYLPRIRIGQQALAQIDDKQQTFKVTKIYPRVAAGQFKIDLVSADSNPQQVRSGQSIQLKLYLGKTEQSIRIPNGSFYTETSGNWIFVVDQKTNKSAQFRKIRLGRSNNYYIEVLDGLSLGEKVITSSYHNYLDAKKLVLTQ